MIFPFIINLIIKSLGIMVYKQITLLLFCLVISVIDCKKFIIPDFLLISLFSTIFVFDCFLNPEIMLNHLLVSILILVVFLIIYKVTGGLGFGDVKFVTVLAYHYGFPLICLVGLVASLSGILFYLIYFFKVRKMDYKIPFAPCLSFACFVIFILGFFVPGI